MENYYMAIQKINSWDTDEQFFRGYYYASQKGQEKLYLQLTDGDPEWIEFAEKPPSIPNYTTEDMFFKNERNISIIKHPIASLLNNASSLQR